MQEQAKAAKAGQVSAGELMALEPMNTAVPQDRFYLLPIFNFSEAFTPGGQPVSLLQVASIDPGNGLQTQTAPPPRALKTAMVFVIDTTLSMDPYIDRTRQVVGKLYDAIRAQTVLLRGAESDLLSHDTAAEMALRGPRAHLVEIPGVGHAPMLMDDVQIAIVRNFLLSR